MGDDEGDKAGAMKQIARVDSNQSELVKLWRSLYLSVHPTHQLGGGFVDAVIGAPGLTIVSRQLEPAVIEFVLKQMGLTGYSIHEGANLMVEIKDGNKPLSAQRLTPDEREWFATWRGQKCIVTNEAEARRIVGIE